MSVHYKFKSALDYDTVTFDGLHISVGDLKAAISQQKRIGKTSDFDLQITNAQTKEVYVDDNTLIPKNTSLLVARVPLSQQPKKQWEGANSNQASLHKDVAPNKGLADLSRMEGSEQDKINAMISQSTFDYDPSNYQKIRGQNQRGLVPTNYICYKCQKHGHWIKDCPAANSGDPIEIRRSTGIPRSFMVPVEGPKAPGAMMTPSGTFAVPAVDHEAYLASENAGGADTPTNAPAAPDLNIPDELICSLCRDLLTDAVMIPCCGNSFCDECIRGALLESEDHECPDCREKEIAPTTLIPNRFLRNSVSSFRNQTGYSRRTPHRPAAAPIQQQHAPIEPPANPQVQPSPNGSAQPGSSSGPPPSSMKPPGIETPPNMLMNMPRIDEQRASTPTIDERRDTMTNQVVFNRGAPPPFIPGVLPPSRRYNSPFRRTLGTNGPRPYNDRYPPEPYQPPPPGIKDSPTNGSRSISRGRLRRSPWSPRRRRTRERTLSLTRSPSPRRRHRSPLRYRSPLRSPMRSPLPRSPLRTPLRSPLRSPPRSPLRSPHRSPLRSPLRAPMRSPPPPRNMSPHRYAGVYDELLSPPRRIVEPPYGARYGPRSSAPPPGYPPMGIKQMAPMGNIPVQSDQPLPGYRGRYEGPPFEEIPPGVEPPVPGFEPSPFEKPQFGPPGSIDRDRLPPPNYRDPYRPPSYGHNDGPGGYRDNMSIPPPVPNEIPVHVGDQPPRYRDNYRPGLYRDQGPMPFRDGQPYREPGLRGPYRDPNFRGGPPPFRDNSYRNVPYREGGFRENPPHNNFRDPSVPFRPPSADPREAVPPNYHDPNYRDNYRDDNGGRDHSRPGFRATVRNKGVPRRTNVEHDRHRDRETRDRERYNDNREPVDKTERPRDSERRTGYEKIRETRDGREDRTKEYERNREHDKERDHERTTPDKKVRSPKRSRETREKKRSESRGRSRDRESRREKKEERTREKTSADRSREHKDKEKKIKERKKKKREKEKDTDKKKKRDKKDKKDKDHVKKEEDDAEKPDVKGDEKDTNNINTESQDVIKAENTDMEVPTIKKEHSPPMLESTEKPTDDLYGDEALGAVDKEIIQNYVKMEDKGDGRSTESRNEEDINISKEEPFDGIELQATAEELDLKADLETSIPTSKEMLATLPELSKWEVDEENAEKSKEPGEITSPEEEEDGRKVTSDVIKRAENAIFAKAINNLRPIEIKKISSDRLKLYGDEAPKTSMNNMQITVPVADSEPRSIEINERKKRYSKTPPPRLSVKDRLGGKVEDVRRGRETRVVQSTVERVKSRSKTPKREQPYRRVTVERERSRKQDRAESAKSERRVMSEAVKNNEKHRNRSPHEKKFIDKSMKEDKKLNHYENAPRDRGLEKNTNADTKNLQADRERKKSTIDEAHFEPDYDETLESDHENKEENVKKRERSASPLGYIETKKVKLDTETIKLDLTNVKKKPDSESESTSDSEYSSSSTSSDARKRKKKKKRSKKKKKRAASESESESESSSDDHKKKKKKRKHKKKSSKKKKKSKHK